MEVIGRGSVTIVDGATAETDAWDVHGHRPVMISGVTSCTPCRPATSSTSAAASGSQAAQGPRGREDRLDGGRSPRADAPLAPGHLGQTTRWAGSRSTGGDRPRRVRRSVRRSAEPHAPQTGTRAGRPDWRRRDARDVARHVDRHVRRRRERRARAPGASAIEGRREGAKREAEARGRQAGAATGAKATRQRASERNGEAGAEPTLRILDTRVLRGPNYWSRQPVVKMLVDLGVLEQFPSNKIPGFIDGLLAWMPSLEDHACSLNRRGGFVTRLKDGTWMGHVAEHIALELQNLAGTHVHHGKTRGAGDDGQYNVIYEYREEAVGLEAGKLAVRIVNHLVAPRDPAQAFDYVAELEASSSSPSARPSGPRPRRSSTRRPRATSRSCASIGPRSSSSARASTSSASAPR